jgi:predicted permease
MRLLDPIFRRGRLDRQLEAELRFHVERQIADYVAQGMAPDDARRRVRLEFGSLDSVQEECRDARPLRWLEDLVKDGRFAARVFLRSPGFTSVAVLTLAVGIGATTAMFTIVHSVLLRPLPFPAADRLVWIRNHNVSSDAHDISSRMSQFRDWRDRARLFEGLAAYHDYFTHLSYNLTGRGEPERLSGIEVSASLFPLLGERPALGRLFRDDEDVPGAAPVVVLSHGLWHRRFGSDPGIVDQPLILNGRSHSVIGVLRPGQALTGALLPGTELDVYLPLVRDESAERLGGYLAVLGRLRPGVSLDQAHAELSAIQAGMAVQRPSMGEFRPVIVPLSERVAGPVRPALVVLFGAVGFVLLAGCANLGNLLLARATARRKEISVRTALGATGSRLLRQMLAESLVLVSLGAAAGIALASAILRLFTQRNWLNLPRLAEVQLDGTPLVFALAVSGVTAIFFGSLPALQGSRIDLADALKEGGRAAAPGRRSQRFRAALVATQVGLALVLLIGTGLLLRSLWRILDVDPGFRPENVIAMRVDPGNRYPPGPRLSAFFDEVLRRVSTLPGVSSAALVYNLPLDRNMVWTVGIPGKIDAPGTQPTAFTRIVSPGYFRTMGITLIEGRDIGVDDRADRTPVVVVNETLARLIAAEHEPLASRLVIGGREHVVVGVVGDVRHQALEREPGAEMYLAHRQGEAPGVRAVLTGFDLVLKTSVDPHGIVPLVRREVWAVDPDQAVGKVVPIPHLVERSLLSRRLLTGLVAAFGGLALLLSVTGVYGVVSYGVAQRTQEIAIRMALGARASAVHALVLRQTASVALLGLLAGIGAAFALTRLLSSQLYGVTRTDPVSFAVAAGGLVALVLLASYLPSRRAARVDPGVALLRQ